MDKEPTEQQMEQEIIELREALAEYAHTAWTGWMEYMWGKCEKDAQGRLVIPDWAVKRWSRQMTTAYSDLPETEKNSDRLEAMKMIAIMLMSKAAAD